MKKTTLLIVDDHTLIRETWTIFFSQNEKFDVIGHTGDGEEAIHIAKNVRPDIVLLDINMSPVDGFEVLKMIRKYSPSTKILGISMHLQPGYAKKMLRAGAKGYVSKGSSTEELLTAVEQIQQGNQYISADIKETLTKQWTDESLDTGFNSLSPRELEVIKYIRNGLSSKSIAELLHLAPRTVEVHRHNILKKLKIKNTASLVELINSHGL
jgi:DNA-binding NarL/FixJ family response regulator